MNHQIGLKWISALRSQDYAQGRSWLRQANDDGEFRYCCLGVLCDIYAQENNKEWEHNPPQNYLNASPVVSTIEDVDNVLPNEVIEWAGLDGEDNPMMDVNGVKIALSDLNDKYEYDFDMLADLIETQLLNTSH
jgi:hypothetical protein